MKLFLVDVHNAIDMSHYGTFFYENINKGNISVFSQTADSLKSLGSVLSWINEEINRNPFSIDNAVVVFFLSRDFTEPRKAQDYEIFSKMYIDELLARNLDRRFRYVCFYLDHTGRDASDDRVYREIAGVDKSFCSDDPALKDSFLPAALPDGDRKETVDKLIRDLPDSVTSDAFTIWSSAPRSAPRNKTKSKTGTEVCSLINAVRKSRISNPSPEPTIQAISHRKSRRCLRS